MSRRLCSERADARNAVGRSLPTWWRVALCLCAALAATALPVPAQPARADVVEVDPIRCWWRTSHGAVSVGQPFSVVLTCAVVENASVRVVPDESPLAVGTVQLSPFELLGGTHPGDLRSGQRRFFQYDYNVRLIDPTAIGRDVSLPTLTIHYRVESQLQAQAIEGRDRTYLLPAQSVRIMSNVPADAADIRDGSEAPFGAIESTRFRARMFDFGAMALASLGVILFVPAVVRAMGLTRKRVKSEAFAVSDAVAIERATSELQAARSEGRGGWTPELISRASNATRVIAGYALGRHASQQPLASAADTPEWRIPISRGLFRTRRVSIASAATAEDLTRAIERLPAGAETQRKAVLEQLRDALATLTRAQYSSASVEDSRIDDAVGMVVGSSPRVKSEYVWWRTLGRRARTRL